MSVQSKEKDYSTAVQISLSAVEYNFQMYTVLKFALFFTAASFPKKLHVCCFFAHLSSLLLSLGMSVCLCICLSEHHIFCLSLS